MKEDNNKGKNMNDNQMQDENIRRELTDEIKKSAEPLEIPEHLRPENLDSLLEKGRTSGGGIRSFSEKMTDFFFRFRKPIGGVVVCGLLAAILVLAPGFQGGSAEKSGSDMASVAEDAASDQEAPESASKDTADSSAAEEPQEKSQTAEEAKEESEESAADKTEWKKVEGIAAASSYEDIYKQIYVESQKAWKQQQSRYYGASDFAAAEEKSESAAQAASDTAAAGGSGGSGAGYSETNVRTEGVDEGDLVKTDGEYIYSLSQTGTLRIVKADGKELSLVNKISLESMDESAVEMYVDGNTLCIIATGYESRLNEQEGNTYLVENKDFTRIYTYDISDKSEGKVELKGKVIQDGRYISSRKSGRYLYLYTDYGSESSARAEDLDSFVPEVNRKRIAPDNMLYPELPQTNTQQLVISSVDLDKPDIAKESVSLLGVTGQFYVSTDNIYIYSEDYSGEDFRTQIVRFSYKDGNIRPEASGMAEGTLNNSFSLDEYEGYLRLVTTSYSRGWFDGTERNALYVMDENLKVTGKVEDIAKGETIRSARFMNDVGYFVTYKQMDPLFTVDLSDPQNPEIIGELKITGFSEYLHFYGEGKLLGMGWETDPDGGMMEGLKLSMFDISNPREVKEIHKMVFENIGHVPALTEYKQVLIDPEKNIFGFAAGTYGADYRLLGNYGVFSYDDKKGFTQELFQSLQKWSGQQEAYMELEQVRGLYIGNTFYLCGSGGIVAYDMEKNYEQSGNLDW